MNELQHSMPPQAQQHLELIQHEGVRQEVAQHIQGLHLIENLQDQSTVEFVPQFAGESERVKTHMTSIAESAASAHAEISVDLQGEASTAEVWSRVLERQLTTAAEAKQRGDSETATKTLMDYLITTELTQRPNTSAYGFTDEEPDRQVATVLDKPVAAGMAQELVEAARRGYGLVHVQPPKREFSEFGSRETSGPLRISSVAHTIETVKPELEIVTDRVVSVDPAEQAFGEKLLPEALQERTDRLPIEAAVATAKGVAASEAYDVAEKPAVMDRLTERVLQALPSERGYVRDGATELLVQLNEVNPSLSDLSKYQKEFRAIRNIRGVNSHYRINDQRVYPLDGALIGLWERGDKELAGRFLTAGNEIEDRGDYASGAIGHIVAKNPELRQEIEAEVMRRRAACEKDLTAALVTGTQKPDVYTGRSSEQNTASWITRDVLSTQDPERATEIILQWAKQNDTEMIADTLSLLHEDVVEGSGYNLMLILTGKENPLMDLGEVHSVTKAVTEMYYKHNFPRKYIRDSELLDNSQTGAGLRARVAFLHDKFPLDLYDGQYVAAKIELLDRIMQNDDPEFTASLEAMAAHPMFVKLRDPGDQPAIDPFNSIVLRTVVEADRPLTGIENFSAIEGSDLAQAFRNLYAVAPSEVIREFLTEAVGAQDIAEFMQTQQSLSQELDAVVEHPLMEMLRPGGMLHSMAPSIMDAILTSDNKLAFCEGAYNSFTKPQPLWKSLSRFTELLVGTKVEALGARQMQPVDTIPFIKLKLGTSAEHAGLDDVEGFAPHAFSELSVTQKRVLAADGLGELGDDKVASLQMLTFDRFTDRAKRTIFAYQLQQTVEQSRDNTSKSQADMRNQTLAGQGVNVVQKGDFIHGTAFDALGSILQDGNVAGEARRSASAADAYPYNVDVGIINGQGSIQEKLEETISFAGYGTRGTLGTAGQVLLVYKRSPESWMAGQETYASERQALIFGGIPSTEITGIVLRDPAATLDAVSRTVVENGFYVPLYNTQGELLFRPDEYSSKKEDLNMAVRIPPENIVDSSVKAADQKGVSEGGLYLFPSQAGPERYYVKFATNPDHTWTEYAADQLYRAVGVAVPDSKVVKVEGRLGRASRWVEEGSELPPSESSTLEDGAAMDMLLANWDVVYNRANIMTVNGTVLRPDSGSALDMWATGTPKIAGTWTNEVRELNAGNDRSKLWEGMRQEYPALTDEQLQTQVQRIQERLTDSVIDSIVDSVRRPRKDRDALKTTLKARRNDMVRKVLGTN